MIYLASPYTHQDEAVRIQRYEAVHRQARLYMDMGKIVFAPIVYGHEFAVFDQSAVAFDYWQRFNEHMLLNSNELYVLMLPNWHDSHGVVAEIDLAIKNGIKVIYVHPVQGDSHESI